MTIDFTLFVSSISTRPVPINELFTFFVSTISSLIGFTKSLNSNPGEDS